MMLRIIDMVDGADEHCKAHPVPDDNNIVTIIFIAGLAIGMIIGMIAGFI